MEQNNNLPKPWYKKTWIIVVGIIFILIIIGNLNSEDKSNKSQTDKNSETSITSKDQEDNKKWTEIYTFKGNGLKKSPSFELSGENARLKYKYQAPKGLGMGVFSVYVVNEGQDIMETGGIPEVMTQSENEESESSIQKSAGRYYLNVNASGDWMVTVEEMK